MSLQDHAACVDLLCRYASGVDHKDWDLWRSAFGERVVWDFETVFGEPPVDRLVTDIVDQMQVMFTGFAATQHAITSHRVSLDGDTAHISAHIRADHWVDPELAPPGQNCWTLIGFYEDDAVRTADGWQLVKVRLDMRYQSGDHVRKLAYREGKRLLGLS